MTIFLDTNVLVATALVRDQHHRRAREVVRSLSTEDAFTTDHVVVEGWFLINARVGWGEAMRFWWSVRELPISLETVTIPDLERAHAIAEIWSDQHFDLVDCTSFAVMERLGCRRAASFDVDFAVYRYGARRDKAFDILR